MKKIYKLILVLVLLLSPIALGCFWEDADFEIITNALSYHIYVGETYHLDTNASELGYRNLKWTSTDEEVLSVNDEGTIIAKSEGEAIIYVTSGEHIATIKYFVHNDPTGFDISDLMIGGSIEGATVYVGDTILLTCNSRSTGFLKDASFESDDANIASIDSNGILLAKEEGKTKINIYVDGEHLSFVINVLSKSVYSSIEIEGKQTYSIGEEYHLSYTSAKTLPNGVLWSVSDDTIASIDADGTVHAKASGLCKVICQANDNSNTSGEYLIYVLPDYKEMDVIINEIYEVIGETDFTNLSLTLNKIIEDNYNSIIGISNFQEIQGTELEAAVGTGFIYRKEQIDTNKYQYYCLTNNHVVKDASYVKVYYQKTEKYIDATVEAVDSDNDIACVSFISNLNFTPLTLGDSDACLAGNFVLAIGHPTGYDFYNSATFGMISYVNRSLPNEKAIYLQHDAAINSGNSGGPLFNMNGEVVGINTLKYAASNISNMGFAVTINLAKEFLLDNNLLY